MTSMPFAPSILIRSVRRPHASDYSHRFLIRRQGALPCLIIPDLMVRDEISILATRILGDPHLAGADAFDAGDAGDSILGRAQIGKLLDKIHGNSSPRHTSDGSVSKSWLSGGLLCHNSVSSLQLSSKITATVVKIPQAQPTTTCSADESPVLEGPASAGRRRQHRTPPRRAAAVTLSSSADGHRGYGPAGASADRRRQPRGVRGHWSPNQQSAAVTHFRSAYGELICSKADRRRRQEPRQAPTAWVRLTASRTHVAAAVTHLNPVRLPSSSKQGRNLAGDWLGNWRPPAFSSFHQDRSPCPIAVGAAHRANVGDAATHSLETRFRRRSP